MIRRLLVTLLVAGLAGAPAAADARTAHPPKHATAEQRAKAKRLARQRAAARRRALAKRKALAQAAAPVAAPVVAPVVLEPPAPEAPVVTEPVAELPVLGHSVGVTARDTPRFLLALSRTEVAAGVVTVQAQNAGEDAHDLRIETLGGVLVQAWDEIASGDAPVVKDVLLAPGTYRVFCSLPGHALAGMDTRIEARAE